VPRITMQLVGFAQLPGVIKSKGEELKEDVTNALFAAILDSQEVAEELCPVDTGYLKSRIQVQWIEQGGNVQRVALYNDASYAIYVELGTSRMSAQAFMTPGIKYGAARLVDLLQGIGTGQAAA
jgi:HK97 gp10 family phage protein